MPAALAPAGPEYANPLAGATVVAERIDQGVDYAGTGTLSAIARGVITKILGPSSSGWPGSYIEYQITDPASSLFGKSIYYAEGVTPATGLKVGQTVSPGQTLASLIPHWATGIELGFASGVGSASYASQHGGYTEGETTRSGLAFSDLVKQLGGPAGKIEGKIGGGAPSFTAASSSGGGAPSGSILDPIANFLGGTLKALGGDPSGINQAAGTVVHPISAAIDVTGAVTSFISNPVPALLTMVLVVFGALLVYGGLGRMLGFDHPIGSTVQAARTAAVIA
jgi:hypothetical protein